MRPSTNAEIAAALRVQSCYANDSETKWLMEESARRIDALAPIIDETGADVATPATRAAAARAINITPIAAASQPAGDKEAEASEAPLVEQNAPAAAEMKTRQPGASAPDGSGQAARPQRLARAKAKVAED